MAAKRYYWLKLGNTYFSQLEQKKMRKQKDGMNMQVIYLRMMLLSIDKDGYIYYQGVYDSIEEELAEEFSEDIELVRRTVEYLQDNNMLDGMDVIKMTAKKMPERAGFMISHPVATVAPTKLEDYKIHQDPPGISGELVEGRIVYDAFVLDNKKMAIYYVENKATE